MKKLFMTLFAALSICVAANACDYITAFSGPQETEGFYVESGKIYVKNCNSTSNIIATYSKNPYNNSNSCAPTDKRWSTCFEYCFTYGGKTYYFNL